MKIFLFLLLALVASCSGSQNPAPSPAENFLNCGKALSDQGKYSEAIKEFTKAIEAEPDNGEAYCLRGIARHHNDRSDNWKADMEKAIELTTKAVSENPKDASAFYIRGNARFFFDPETAIADYSRAVEAKPDFKEAYMARMQLAYLMGKHDICIADYIKIIELEKDPERIEFFEFSLACSYLHRGKARLESGKYKGAIEDFTKAIEIQSKDPTPADYVSADLFYRRGEAKRLSGDGEAAAADYKKVIEISDKAREAYPKQAAMRCRSNYWRGIARRRLGDIEGAVADLENYLKEAVDSKVAPDVEQAIDEMKSKGK